jgi:TolB protein
MIGRLVAAATLVFLAHVAAARDDDRPELAYLAVADGYWEVWLAHEDGKQARQLTHSKNDKTRVSWYPDGSALLAGGNDGRVVRVDMEGRETQIPLQQQPVIDAVISPDGRHLAYSFSSARDGNDIWIANSDGTGAQKIARMKTLQHEPAWSADGAHIYFLSGDGGQAHDIWRVALDGQNAEQLTVGSLYHFDIAVSNDGALAYSSNRSGNYEIYLQRQNAEAEQLTNDAALDARSTFSPDGSALIFESSRGGVLNLWRLDIRSRELHQITHNAQGARAPAWYQGNKR